MKHKAGRVLGLAISGCAAVPATVPPAPNAVAPPVLNGPRQPTKVTFGVMREDDVLVPATTMVRAEEPAFGWRIELPCWGPVHYREVLTLPGPGDWPSGEDAPELTVSADRRVATTVQYAACVDNAIEHRWSVASGDPLGEWTLVVDVDGFARQSFHATVE